MHSFVTVAFAGLRKQRINFSPPTDRVGSRCSHRHHRWDLVHFDPAQVRTRFRTGAESTRTSSDTDTTELSHHASILRQTRQAALFSAVLFGSGAAGPAPEPPGTNPAPGPSPRVHDTTCPALKFKLPSRLRQSFPERRSAYQLNPAEPSRAGPSGATRLPATQQRHISAL